MYVAQFLHALFFVADRKVVESRLPEGPFAAAHGYRELERVHHAGDRAVYRLADEQVNMFRHDNVAGYHETVPHSCTLQGIFKQAAGRRCAQMLELVITTEGNKVETAEVLVTNQSAWHGRKSYDVPGPVSRMDVTGWSGFILMRALSVGGVRASSIPGAQRRGTWGTRFFWGGMTFHLRHPGHPPRHLGHPLFWGE